RRPRRDTRENTGAHTRDRGKTRNPQPLVSPRALAAPVFRRADRQRARASGRAHRAGHRAATSRLSRTGLQPLSGDAADPGATRVPLRRLDAADVPGTRRASLLLHAYPVDPGATRATQGALRHLRRGVAAVAALSVANGCR